MNRVRLSVIVARPKPRYDDGVSRRGAIVIAFGMLVACSVDAVAYRDGKSPENGPTTAKKTDGGVVTMQPDSGPGSTSGDSGGPDAASTEDSGGNVPDTGTPGVEPCVEDRLLVGNNSLTGLEKDNAISTEVNAFPFTAVASSVARCLRVHLSTSIASAILVGVYSDVSALPSDRISTGTILTPVVGWNKAVLDNPITLAPQARVWLAIVPKVSEVDLLVRRNCSGRRRHFNANGDLPAKFTPESDSIYCDPAFYLSP